MVSTAMRWLKRQRAHTAVVSYSILSLPLQPASSVSTCRCPVATRSPRSKQVPRLRLESPLYLSFPLYLPILLFSSNGHTQLFERAPEKSFRRT